jgi:hypothetical protein
MNTKSTTCIASVIAAIFLSWPASAQTVTLTGSQLAPSSGVAYQVPGAGASAGYVSTGGGYANLTSPDNVSGGAAQFNDTAMVVVNNGFDGISLGTLNNLLAQGAAGHVSFYLSSMTQADSEQAYWNVLLVDPNNSANTLLVNAFSDRTSGGAGILGANPFNQGVAGNSSVDASISLSSGGVLGGLFTFGSTWSTVAAVSDDGNTLGKWNVASVSIDVGGWDSSLSENAQISSITLPDGVPDANSTLPLLGICFGALAGLRRRLHRG